jgi:hypothetical protein
MDEEPPEPDEGGGGDVSERDELDAIVDSINLRFREACFGVWNNGCGRESFRLGGVVFMEPFCCLGLMTALLGGSSSSLGGMFISARMLCSLPVVVVVVEESGAACRSVDDPCVSPMREIEACRGQGSEVCPNGAASKSSGLNMVAPNEEEDADEVDEAGVGVVGEMYSGVKAAPSSTPAVTGAELRGAGMDRVERDGGIPNRSKSFSISHLGKTSWNGKMILLSSPSL